EVAVIDEIQMIEDINRGNAWTQALIGIQADEMHLCGDDTAIDVVKRIAAECGDEFYLKEYKRLTKLEIEDKPVDSTSKIKNGDCIVCFSKESIYRVSERLKKGNIKHAIIYGAMTPKAKTQQTQLFNNANTGVDALVATDAIGMGLN
ncbi:MAG: ATP-dependent RNA helicase supv3l1, mitochondrial, partial [Paramarteilia canceri]